MNNTLSLKNQTTKILSKDNAKQFKPSTSNKASTEKKCNYNEVIQFTKLIENDDAITVKESQDKYISNPASNQIHEEYESIIKDLSKQTA